MSPKKPVQRKSKTGKTRDDLLKELGAIREEEVKLLEKISEVGLDDKEIKELQDEVNDLREKLRNKDDELQVQKEELSVQAEELEAQLEELRCTGEDLEKTNRELKIQIKGRKDAETANAYLAAIVESSEDAILSKSLDGTITSWNSSAEKMFGYTADEMIGRSKSILIPYENRKELSFILDNVKNGKPIEHYETVRKRKDGKIIDVSISVSPIKNKSGIIIGASTIARDITERKKAELNLQEKQDELEAHAEELRAKNDELQGEVRERKRAEEALRESQAFLRAVTDGSPDPIFVKDLASRIMLANPATLQVWGKSLEDVIGKNDRELYADTAIGEAIMANDRRVLESGRSQAIEEVVQTKDGYRTFLSTKTPYRNSNGEIVGILGIARDITERKLAEDELWEMSNYLDSLINYANAPIIVWGPDFKITRFNHAFERLTGYLSEDMIGKELEALFPPDSREESIVKIKRTLAGEYWESVEIPILRKDRNTRIALWNSANIYDKDDKTLMATIAQGQDITERKRTEAELKDAKAQAELYLDLMGHDISNMHQIIMGQLELAREIMDSDCRLEVVDRELIDTSLDTLERGSKLIENVRNLQRLRRGEFNEEIIDLNELISGVILEYENLLPEGSIKFEKDGRHPVKANKLLHDVFSNLIGNAIKHSNGNNMDITINLDKANLNGQDYYKASVNDNGPGIPDDMKDKIFNRLQRGETNARGMGLGLYIVKTLTESYGGFVKVEDRVPGDHTKGAKFLVYLPVENIHVGE